MPITREQAIEWAGSATAEGLTAVRSPRPDGRLTPEMVLHMMSVSTRVVHCFIPGGDQPPFLPCGRQAENWCRDVLRRDERKRETLINQVQDTKLAHKNGADDPMFLKTFGDESVITPRNSFVPFVRVGCIIILHHTWNVNSYFILSSCLTQ